MDLHRNNLHLGNLSRSYNRQLLPTRYAAKTQKMRFVLPLFEIVELERLEVAQEDIARNVVVL